MTKPFVENVQEFPCDGNIVDVVNSSLTYWGESQDPDATTAQAKWRIRRILKIGTATRTIFAGIGSEDFSQIWDDRNDGVMFSVPALLNTQSLLFDGVNDEVNHGDTFKFDHSNQFSIGMWIKPDNIAAARALFAKTTPDANVHGFNLRHEATTGALFWQMRSAGTLRQHTFDIAVTAGAWQFIVVTYNGSSNINGTRAYRNAVVGNTPATGPLVASLLSGQDFTMGSRNTTFEFSGNIDQVTVWDKALSSTEVTTLYGGGTPPDPTLLSFAGDLVSWFPVGTDEGDSSTTLVDNVGSNNGTLLNFSASPFESDVP